jgi:S-methylmethionine-dependent homocysteine/selenocysteine methylase
MGKAWKETLDRGDVLLIDGGMGTELQRRGVPMDEAARSA